MTTFEYSQIAVKQDVREEEEEALVCGDYWQVDGLRRELIRHHKDKRQNLHDMNRSETTPIPKDQLLDERVRERDSHGVPEEQEEVLHKDNWRSEGKRFADKMEEFWKGKTVYKIKKDYVIPENVVKSDLDRAKPFRGSIDDMCHPESAFSEPSDVQKKPLQRRGTYVSRNQRSLMTLKEVHSERRLFFSYPQQHGEDEMVKMNLIGLLRN